jgi:protein tyrosine phosphatase (PTP) superfamily phosphohydrolase (DUF442 family)
MSIDGSFNFRRISERLSTSGIVDVEQLANLRNEGYEVVINLMPDSESPLDNEARIVGDQDINYVYIPVDFGAPTRADFEAFADALDRAGDRRVHVHCAANYRVSAFYSVYAFERGLCSARAARELVLDVWDPAEFPIWLAFISGEYAWNDDSAD